MVDFLRDVEKERELLAIRIPSIIDLGAGDFGLEPFQETLLA
jgi:hypothetical protein